MLHHLVYVSDVNEDHHCDMEKVIKNAIQTNSELNVSGALWYTGIHFIQLLEGSKEDLDRVFNNKIAIARSHKNICMLSFQACKKRIFKDWSMAYLSPYGRTGEIAATLVDLDTFNPRQCEPHTLIQLLRNLEEERRESARTAII